MTIYKFIYTNALFWPSIHQPAIHFPIHFQLRCIAIAPTLHSYITCLVSISISQSDNLSIGFESIQTRGSNPAHSIIVFFLLFILIVINWLQGDDDQLSFGLSDSNSSSSSSSHPQNQYRVCCVFSCHDLYVPSFNFYYLLLLIVISVDCCNLLDCCVPFAVCA